MANHGQAMTLEEQIDLWRSYLRRRQAIHSVDAAELEDHLRELVAGLMDAGLASDEAFLVAVKRMGDLDALSREFAREHSDRLWKQLVLSGDGWEVDAASAEPYGSRKMWVALVLAVGTAVAIKLPNLFGIGFNNDDDTAFYLLNISFLTLPFIIAYFAWERPVARSSWLLLAAVFAAAALVVNAFPFSSSTGSNAEVLRAPVADTEMLTALHLPLALWLGVGVAYVGGRWRSSERRMDFCDSRASCSSTTSSSRSAAPCSLARHFSSSRRSAWTWSGMYKTGSCRAA